MTLLGHVREIRDGRIVLADDLERNLAAGDRDLEEFTSAVDDHLRGREIDTADVRAPMSPRPAAKPIDEIDIQASGIRSVVWATGYQLDFRWVELPIVDSRGEPVQRRGATSAPGIYFLGLAWMHKVKSSFLYGVGEDAEYLAERISGPNAAVEMVASPGAQQGNP
jgi:putative flavoprotein involved in K+ transport